MPKEIAPQNLPKLRQILRAYYHKKNATESHVTLANDLGKNTQDFLSVRGLRQKIPCFKGWHTFKYDPKHILSFSFHGMILHMKLQDGSLTDEALLWRNPFWCPCQVGKYQANLTFPKGRLPKNEESERNWKGENSLKCIKTTIMKTQLYTTKEKGFY